MGCFSPLQAYKSVKPKKNGKNAITFSPTGNDIPIKLPCGQCTGCRLSRSFDWAIRCMHEGKDHAEQFFLTLTYNDEKLPYDESLTKPHFQKFMKRLRKKYSDKKIRFYMCGEYGENNTKRPHYHAIIYGHAPDDLIPYGKDYEGKPLYTSPTIAKIWGKGNIDVGQVTFESAAYVARYIMKKQLGPEADYWHLTATGLTVERQPEYTDMSRKPGIGGDWLEQNYKDIYPNDFMVIKKGDNFTEVRPTRYYDSLYEKMYPEKMQEIKQERAIKAFQSDHFDPDRIKAKQIITEKKINLLKRTL